MLTYESAADSVDPYSLVPHVLPWILEAGSPYYTWLFGNAERALQVLEAWMRRESSEVSVLRAQILRCDTEIAGGFIALGGMELQRARKADAIALLGVFSHSDRAGLVRRLASANSLFSKVADDEYYLSKMGLNLQFRRKGYGQALLEKYVREGESKGYVRYRLDVNAHNISAIRLYRSFGFEMDSPAGITNDSMEYCSMRYQLVHA